MKAIKHWCTRFLALAVAAALTACADGGNDTPKTTGGTPDSDQPSTATDTPETPDGDNILQVVMTTSPVGMHPLKTNDAPSTEVNAQIFETLYQRTYEGDNYEPLLAEALPEFSDDGQTATIKLRENITFHDGTPFTAEAVGYMIDCLKDPDYGSLRPSIVESIKDYEIVDDHTIKLHLEYEDGVLVAKLAHTNSAIVNPELDKSQDLLVDPTGAGTGPFVFDSATVGSVYTVKANENYWGEKPDLDGAVYTVVADETSALARLQTGEADMLANLNPSNFESAKAIEGYTAKNTPSSAVYYIAQRSDKDFAQNPLMADLDFRRALIQGMDFETYATSMMGEKASYNPSIVGPTLVGYTEAMDDASLGYDPEAAKAAIDSHGWAGEKVVIFTATRPWQQELAVYMQAQLQELGLQVEILAEEWASFLSSRDEAGKFDIIILSWSNVTGDAHQMLEPNFSTANGKAMAYNNAEFDAFLDQAAQSTDLKVRQEALLNAVKKLQGDAIADPVYSPNQLYAFNATDYDDITLDQSGLLRLIDVKVK